MRHRIQLFDVNACASQGQIELYTHHPFLPTLVRNLTRMGIRVSAAYLIESQFMEDRYKFFSGVLSAMSAMVNLEIPWINVMSKMDLVTSRKEDDSGEPRNGLRRQRDIARRVGFPLHRSFVHE